MGGDADPWLNSFQERFELLQFLVAGMRPFSPAIEHVSVQSLMPYPRNARRHSRAQIKQIAASIERFGLNNPVLIADDGGIIAGHGRVAAAKLLGIETVPAVRLSHLTEVERRAYVIADNKLALNAGWDREMLAIELQGLVDLDFEVELTGFSAALLGEEIIDLICTDPPYNVPIDGHVRGSGHIRHRNFAMGVGEMNKDQFTRFLADTLGRAAARCRDGAIAVRSCNLRVRHSGADRADIRVCRGHMPPVRNLA